jgi:hypothetical protein
MSKAQQAQMKVMKLQHLLTGALSPSDYTFYNELLQLAKAQYKKFKKAKV